MKHLLLTVLLFCSAAGGARTPEITPEIISEGAFPIGANASGSWIVTVVEKKYVLDSFGWLGHLKLVKTDQPSVAYEVLDVMLDLVDFDDSAYEPQFGFFQNDQKNIFYFKRFDLFKKTWSANSLDLNSGMESPFESGFSTQVGKSYFYKFASSLENWHN